MITYDSIFSLLQFNYVELLYFNFLDKLQK